jgi:sugar lactone lactonase YvrE
VEAHVGTGIDLDREGRVFFTDTLHNRIWRLDPDGKLTSLAQNMHLDFLIVGDDGNLYLIDDRSWKLTPEGYLTEVLRSSDIPKTIAWAFAIDSQGNIKGPQTRFGKVNAATMGPDGFIYALDQEQHIRKVSPDGTDSILAHSEEACYAEGGEEKRMRTMGLAVDAANSVYVANYWKRAVFKLSPNGIITTVVSSVWPWVPTGVAVRGRDVYVLERIGNPYAVSSIIQASTLEDRLGSPRVRKVTPGGKVTTLAVVPAERGLAVIVVVSLTIAILAIAIWRVRRKQLLRRSA